MGAWGADTFDNDTACDWTYELEEADDLTPVWQALEAVKSVGDEYLDSDEACIGLAACEVVARLKGNWGARNSYTEPVDTWVDDHPQAPSDELVQLALEVIKRVRTKPSELVDLWEDAGSADWKRSIDSLERRVRE